MGGCLKAAKAEGRKRKVVNATSAPIAKVIAASWNAGIFPVATVSTASSDHIRIAERPIRVAVRGDIAGVLVMPGPCAGHPRLTWTIELLQIRGWPGQARP